MILLLAGTKEGRQIGKKLSELGCDFLATTATEYGAKLLKESQVESSFSKALDREDLIKLIKEKEINLIIDATHPYAKIVSGQAIEVSKKLNIPYIRFQRPSIELQGENIFKVKNYYEATEKMAQFGKRVFLSTGSKTLDIFVPRAKETGQELTVRVLPHPDVINKCYSLGLGAKEIIAMQGPFTKEMNLIMLKESGATVLITKDSGVTGGTDAKVLAAKELNLPVIVIDRPQLDYGQEVSTLEEIVTKVKKI